MRTGLVSVSFRNKSPEEILRLCVRAGLSHVEWGGDVHVPAGDIGRAEEVQRLSSQYGVGISSYGSYYRLGSGKGFEKALESAAALGAPRMRIWAGEKGSRDADPSYRARLEEDGRRIRELAEKKDVRLFFEYHRNTMTDSLGPAMEIMAKTGIGCYWQPNPEISEEERMREVRALSPQTEIVHVFAWEREDGHDVRHMLNEHEERWRSYAGAFRNDALYLLEFSMDDDDLNTVIDAGVLKDILSDS